MKVTIIGSGNVATVMGLQMVAAGHNITQVYAHTNVQQAQALAALVNATVVTHFSQLNTTADIYLLAVSDSALPVVAQLFPKVNGLVLHTAGAIPMNILQNTSPNYGILYPLQSLRKEKRNYTNIPLLIDGNTEATLAAINTFANTLSNQVQQANDTYRLKLHAAAVVVSNFTNHLYALAANFCQHENVDFSLLQPLIEETAERLQDCAPAQMQTGPAIRGDDATIYRHLQLLQHYPQLQQVYEVLTKSIQQTNEQ